MFGELLHLDGSVHAWFTRDPEARPCLIAVSDDATKRVLQAAFYPSESRQAVMTSLAAVLRTEGIPMALYTDRAHWAFHTPTAKGPVDKTQLTQVGRALARLGVEHIPAYSPQARGRSERLNRTFQDRLVNELRVAGIATIEAANGYLADRFVPQHNATFARAPRDPASAFVALGSADLDAILCHEETRIVARDNTPSASTGARTRSNETRPDRSFAWSTRKVRIAFRQPACDLNFGLGCTLRCELDDDASKSKCAGRGNHYDGPSSVSPLNRFHGRTQCLKPRENTEI